MYIFFIWLFIFAFLCVVWLINWQLKKAHREKPQKVSGGYLLVYAQAAYINMFFQSLNFLFIIPFIVFSWVNWLSSSEWEIQNLKAYYIVGFFLIVPFTILRFSQMKNYSLIWGENSISEVSKNKTVTINWTDVTNIVDSYGRYKLFIPRKRHTFIQAKETIILISEGLIGKDYFLSFLETVMSK